MLANISMLKVKVYFTTYQKLVRSEVKKQEIDTLINSLFIVFKGCMVGSCSCVCFSSASTQKKSYNEKQQRLKNAVMSQNFEHFISYFICLW